MENVFTQRPIQMYRKNVKPQIGMYIAENWDSFKLPFVVWVQYGSHSFRPFSPLFSNDKFAA